MRIVWIFVRICCMYGVNKRETLGKNVYLGKVYIHFSTFVQINSANFSCKKVSNKSYI